MVTAKLICPFVFAYAKVQLSHDEAHIVKDQHDKAKRSELCSLAVPDFFSSPQSQAFSYVK